MIEFENPVLNWLQSRYVMDQLLKKIEPHEIHVSFHMSKVGMWTIEEDWPPFNKYLGS
jgi:hypothetical protein